MFVWDMEYWDHRGEEYKVPATSVPYWHDICGEKTTNKDQSMIILGTENIPKVMLPKWYTEHKKC